MSWEKDVINAAKSQKQLNDRDAECRAKLQSSFDTACSVIVNYCKNFKDAGANVTYDFQYGGFSVYICTDGINGSIFGSIHCPASYFGASKLAIVVKCHAHESEKEFMYRGDICENDVIEWVKYATKRKSIFDLLKGL